MTDSNSLKKLIFVLHLHIVSLIKYLSSVIATF